ncbi:MAG: PKD domain-containing protein, partial [Solirubrobacterales bacterium]|nr:PKD domain-containing protein [Solirubrobacterales bacterium]
MKIMSLPRFLIGIIISVLFLITPKALSQPVAGFTYTFTNGGCEPDSIVFTNTSTGAVYYEWNFGDFSPIDTNVNPYHWYGCFWSPYMVILTAYDTLGNSDTATAVINIECFPFADFWPDPLLICPGNSVEFVNWSFPDNADFLWIFDDGDSSTVFNPTHTYLDSGVYVPTLIATTACGSDTTPGFDT